MVDFVLTWLIQRSCSWEGLEQSWLWHKLVHGGLVLRLRLRLWHQIVLRLIILGFFKLLLILLLLILLLVLLSLFIWSLLLLLLRHVHLLWLFFLLWLLNWSNWNIWSLSRNLVAADLGVVMVMMSLNSRSSLSSLQSGLLNIISDFSMGGFDLHGSFLSLLTGSLTQSLGSFCHQVLVLLGIFNRLSLGESLGSRNFLESSLLLLLNGSCHFSCFGLELFLFL